jgi:hypothetical protein
MSQKYYKQGIVTIFYDSIFIAYFKATWKNQYDMQVTVLCLNSNHPKFRVYVLNAVFKD